MFVDGDGNDKLVGLRAVDAVVDSAEDNGLSQSAQQDHRAGTDDEVNLLDQSSFETLFDESKSDEARGGALDAILASEPKEVTISTDSSNDEVIASGDEDDGIVSSIDSVFALHLPELAAV